jgi:hypothetical protein
VAQINTSAGPILRSLAGVACLSVNAFGAGNAPAAHNTLAAGNAPATADARAAGRGVLP